MLLTVWAEEHLGLNLPVQPLILRASHRALSITITRHET